MVQFNLGGITFGKPSVFKSVQYGSISIPGGNLSGTATINAVNVNNSVIIYLGSSGHSDYYAIHMARVEITSSTQVTAYLGYSGGGYAMTINFVVFEFYSGYIKSRQPGTITMSSSDSGTFTINAVNTSKAVLFYSGQTQEYADNGENHARVTLTNSTTVTAIRDAGYPYDTVVGFTVVEFY